MSGTGSAPARPARRSAASALLAVALGAGGVVAQEPTVAAGAAPAAAVEDIASIDAILTAVYEVISGDAGEERDWDRFRSLFLPEGRLIPGGNDRDGTPSYTVLGVEEYVDRVGPQLERRGFHEVEIGRVTERFGNVAHAFSSYASRRDPDDAEPFQRGVNSFQLWNDGDRWWIVSILWDWERPDVPIPGRYLRP